MLFRFFKFRIERLRLDGALPSLEKKTFILGKISKLHTISLSKFDLNNPETLAAFADPNLETESDWDSDELSAFSSIVEEEDEDVFIIDPIPADEKGFIFLVLVNS